MNHSDTFEYLQMNAMVIDHNQIYYRNVFCDGKKLMMGKNQHWGFVFQYLFVGSGWDGAGIDKMKILERRDVSSSLPSFPFIPFSFFLLPAINWDLGTKFTVMLVSRRLIKNFSLYWDSIDMPATNKLTLHNISRIIVVKIIAVNNANASTMKFTQPRAN